jgi:hypothetical protein
MNVKGKFDTALSIIKAREGQITDKVKRGSQDPKDLLEMSYLSGLHNGYKFVWWVLDHPTEVTDQKFDAMLNEILHLKPLVVN